MKSGPHFCVDRFSVCIMLFAYGSLRNISIAFW